MLNVKEKYGIKVDGYLSSYEDYPFSKKFVDACMFHIKKSSNVMIIII